jgi:hypothetical protein
MAAEYLMADPTTIPLIGTVPSGNSAPTHHVTMEQLLEDEPLHSPQTILILFSQPQFGNIAFPSEIHIHCDHQKCEGVRRHALREYDKFQVGGFFYSFAVYGCTNCTTTIKIFGLKAERNGNKRTGICTKIYQEPTFGQPIPKRLFHIIGEDNREHFLQARAVSASVLMVTIEELSKIQNSTWLVRFLKSPRQQMRHLHKSSY